MFFKKGSLKIFTILTGKHLRLGLSLLKLLTFRPATFLKRDFNTGVSYGYCKHGVSYGYFKNSFFYKKPPMAASDSPNALQ